jgi:hypothetical protein
MNEAKWTRMVVVRAAAVPAVIATECRTNQGTNDCALYLEKTSIRGGQRTRFFRASSLPLVQATSSALTS